MSGKGSAEPPLVSVVSVYYNRADDVDHSVQSLIKQDHLNFEVLLVDDGSTDGTREALLAYSGGRVRVLSHSNCGFVSSIRTVIDNCSGQYIAVHGSGDISYPSRLSKQARILDQKPGVGVVGCHILANRNFGGKKSVTKMPSNLPFRRTLMKTNLFSHGEVMFRRDIYEKVGGYREFFKFGQDRDLWLRMSLFCDYHIVPEELYERKILPGGVGSSLNKLILQGYLSDFAIQCAERIDRGQPDPLGEYGHLAPFMRHRSADLALRFASVGIRWMVLRDEARGWALLQRAKDEKLTPRVFLYWLLGLSHKVALPWRGLVKPLMQRRLGSG